GSHEADECKQTNLAEHVCLFGGDIYNDPSFLRFYQNDDTPPWGNNKCKEKGEDGPEWIVRIKFKDELANFMLEKKSHAKGIGDMLDQHRKELHEQFSQILSTIRKSETPEPEAPTFAIITRSGVSTQDPPFPALPRPTSNNLTEGEIEKEGPEGAEPTMIHMPKGAKVLKDLLSHKEKLEKAASSVKLSDECSVIIQRSLPQKEGDPGSVTLPFDFVVLEMDEDKLVLIILGWPFLAMARAVIDVHEGKLSLRVGSEIVTFNIGKFLKSKHSRDDYLYYADHTAKLVHEQWVDKVNHDGKWAEEEEEDSNEVLAVSFYPRTEPVEPLEWKALEN
ncbi:reverse transcriptase domain-containing protein, partial [Tanacetum coccineum]